MTYKYQLIFLGDINNNACNTIKVRFFDKDSSYRFERQYV